MKGAGNMHFHLQKYVFELIFCLVLCCSFLCADGEVIKDPTLCGRLKCNVPAARKFKYIENTLYKYRYHVNVSTNLGEPATPGEPKQESTLHIDATVHLYFTTPCEGHLRITDSSINHNRLEYNADFPDRSGMEFKTQLEKSVLRFAFDDGSIRELCPDQSETVWSLNIKRGVLSMLQNSMKRFDVDHRTRELDVNGICETKYLLHEAKRTSLIVRKHKNLANCDFNGKHLSVIQSNGYKSPLSQSKTLRQPLLKSESLCEITIDHNVYAKVTCKDTHKLQPLSNLKKAGVRTELSSMLELLQEIPDGENQETEDAENYDYEEANEEEAAVVKYGHHVINTKRSNLLYDHARAQKAMHGELRTSRDLLKGMCKLGHNSEELQQRFSLTFTGFIHSARLLDYPSLSQLFERANTICKTGRKHVINALPYIGSNAAVNVMKDLIMKRYVNKEMTNTWVTAFALIPRPDVDTISILSPLVDFQREIPESQFILSYSAVIHAYCSNAGDVDCHRLEPIARFLLHLEKTIENGCSPRFHSLPVVKQTLEALKAVGNMGVETKTLLDKLKQCIDNKGGFLPMNIRVAAVEAHRRLPSCEETRDHYLLGYYRNFTLDTEIRIASYLQVMRCPNYNVVKIIKHTLQEEEVNQVGSFVWSHLTNLLMSSSPTRIEIQTLLTDRDLGDKFNSDIRKYSRNYDGSFFSEEYNFGANYQSNLIFSPKSYMPRSVNFNVTVDVFGESINAFEVDVRMEGLEYYAENIFGPEGPFNNEKIGKHFNEFLRQFRSAPNQEDDYWRRMKQLPNVIDNNFDNPTITVGYKIFGNDLKFTMLNGDKEIKASLSNLNPWTKIKQILSGQEIHYEKTAMFLDTAYVVPTTAGVPIKLELSGSAACNFKLSGMLESKRLASNQELQVVGNVVPSVSVDIVGSMTVDAFYKGAGVKLRTNVYSSGALNVNLNVKGVRLVSLDVGLPNRKMEVFSILTDVLLVKTNGAESEERAVGALLTERMHQHQHQHQQGMGKLSSSSSFPSNVDTISNVTCSWPALDRLIGLKLCTEYQFPNVTKNPNASYFLLNGPTIFKMSVIKADPTARSYLLEYKWERNAKESIIRVAFDTPGSRMKRELSATLTFDVLNNNVTLLLKSAGNSLIAKGTYKKTDNETLIDVGLDINGTKHLDASVGYSRKRGTYGYTYSPKLYLAINSERIAELSGTIRNAQKHNVSQCDIDLTFETKKVWSRMLGYIMKRNIGVAGNIKLDYQLQRMPRKETLQVELALSNRSSKTLTHKEANLKLHSTAYPQLNAVVSTWYQQALGHLEFHAEVNSKPHLQDDRHKLTLQFVLTYSRAYFQQQGAKVNAYVAVMKPIQNLDIKLGINHFCLGAESKTNLLVRYAPGKEIILIINLIRPRGAMFAIEGHANLTIPNFNSMLIDARINEKSRHEYDLDFAGTWFSGHNVTARGTYSDKSTLSVTSHSLKVLLKSPSFENDILVNCKIFNNNLDLRVSLFVEQLDHDKYAFVLNHTTHSSTKLMTYVEGRYKNNVYSILTNVDTQREIRIEMHVDRWRDVHLILTKIEEDRSKEYGLELKWDANRDPALKLAIFLQLAKYLPTISTLDDNYGNTERNLSAVVTVFYPGRLVIGSCLLALRNTNNYLMNAKLEWATNRTVWLIIDTDYNIDDDLKSVKLISELITPFENWKKTSFNARYLQTDTMLSFGTSAYWQDSQHLIADFQGSSLEKDDKVEYSANCGLTSTVHSIRSITANVTHKLYDRKSCDTRLTVKYYPDRMVQVRSLWNLDKVSDDSFNFTGNLQFVSPLVSYRKGEMRCYLAVTPDWKVQGAANLDLEKRKYTASLLGDLTLLRESGVQFNLTTPLERYAFIRGQFGLSERNRHVVAKVVTPNGCIGFEGIFQLLTANYDLNLKLFLATPIDLLQRSLLVAKLNQKEADFRLAYNNITVGFQGVWHYNNITDFHYSYIIYTPIHGFHETGIITKLILINTEPDGVLDVDSEFSIRLVETKIGIRAIGGPKNPPMKIPVISKVAGFENEKKEAEENEDDYEDEEDEEETFYWEGEIELDIAIVEPMIGTLNLENEGLNYKIQSVLIIPPGKIVIDNRFSMEDVFDMKNDLNIETPFLRCSEITSLYVFRVDMEKSMYLMSMNLNVKNYTELIESGYMVNYTRQKGDSDSKTHTVQLDVKTPLKFMKYLNTKTVLEVDENFYKVKINIDSDNCTAELLGSLEMEEQYMDTAFYVKVDSPMLTIARTKIAANKDFTDKSKHLAFEFFMEESVPKMTKFEINWQAEEPNYLKASFALETWLKAIKSLEAEILYVNYISINDTSNVVLKMKRNNQEEFKLIGDYKTGGINVDLETPLKSNEHLVFTGNVIRNHINNVYVVKGDLKNLKTLKIYDVVCNVKNSNVNDAFTLDTRIRPKNGKNGEEMNVKVTKQKYSLEVEVESDSMNSSVNFNYINSFNWDVRSKADVRKEKNQQVEKYELSTFMNVQVNGNTTIFLSVGTPWEDLENLKFDCNFFLNNETGNVKVDHLLNDDRRVADISWKLQYMIDMFVKLQGRHQIGAEDVKDIYAVLFLQNPAKAFRTIVTGFDVNVDKDRWRFATNVTVGYRNSENIDAIVAVTLPPPDRDDHKFLVSYHANKGIQNASYVVGYTAIRARTNYASDGSMRVTSGNVDGHLRLNWGLLATQTINNLFKLTYDPRGVDLRYSLFTPWHLQEETVILSFNCNGTDDERNLINADLHYPARKRLANLHISYLSLINVNGTINASIPSDNVDARYGGCNFIVQTNLNRNKRFIEFFWPNNTALLNSEYTYHSQRLDSNLDGQVLVEVPLNTRHIGHLTYGYRKRPLFTTGYSKLTYNNQSVVDATYDCKSESRAGFEKDDIRIILKNIYRPLGVNYVNQYEYSGGNEGTNYPTRDHRVVNVYRLDNATAFNVTGESNVKTTHSGQEVHLKALNFGRTVQLKTDYQVLPGEFEHNSWLSLSEDGAWISYRLNILNETTEDVRHQLLTFDLAYPKRNFTFKGFYKITELELNSEAKLEWDRDTSEPRNIGASFFWSNDTLRSDRYLNQQLVIFSLRHPTFEKNVTFAGKLTKKDPRDLLDVVFSVDYSPDVDKLLTLSIVARDESQLPIFRKYSYQVKGRHTATNFDLDVHGFVHKLSGVLLETENYGRYRRRYMSEETGRFLAKLDVNARELQFQRENNENVKYLRLNFYPQHPVYAINGSVINTPDLNATGDFYLNFKEKDIWMMVNYTPDAVESLRMNGKIPDARNAVFDIWRTYDQDLTISDVSFYLKLNHSRLVTSTLRWRPELKKDVINIIKTTITNMYDQMGKDVDYWKQYIRSETVNVISEVWEDAQEDIKFFLDDWNNLKELEGDFEDLKIYLNDSYNANDFYIKDIVAVGIYVIDELSLRSHIQSLPNIFNEIWEIMGESGEAIRSSLLWVIETIKNIYHKFSEIASAVLKGESISQLATVVERFIEKYDMFVKDLHVSFIKYIENLWNKISHSLTQQWYRFLKLMEPTFIRFLHYLETVAWKASKEVVDFLYDRKNDIMTSPYFDRFTNFTQDIDRFYKDIKGNDIITNIQKYSTLIFQFLQERYFKFVPFGKELKDVVDEIVSEIKELTKLPSVKYSLDKIQQVYERLSFFYEYFQIRAKIETTVKLLHSKLMDISQSALQAESKYREAKTKFIFDPNQGLMCLEQKLPMSWHAFNQTPEFQEIPEYRAIADMSLYFTTSNATFWGLYYQYKPYTELSNWLPPFKAQAMIIGKQHFVTFDGKHYDFAGKCTYLLARDFINEQFTVLIKYNHDSGAIRHKIIVLIGKEAVEVDIFEDAVKSIHSGQTLHLPSELDNGTAFIYQSNNLITVERKDGQFKLDCNLKYNLCTIELSGWYFGKTAGLLGTMSNEQMDDTLTVEGIDSNIQSFANTWRVDDGCRSNENLATFDTNGPISFCQELFVNKSSEFSSCFGIVDPHHYLEICFNTENELEACTVAMAYMESCGFRNNYLRIPDRCTTCAMIDGSIVPEGGFRQLEGASLPKSTDVVFLVEAKECNRDVRHNRSMDQLVLQLNKELMERGLQDNHYSLVVFGGDGVHDKPRNLILNNQIFTKNVAQFVEYFDDIPVGHGSEDIFGAIGYALKLTFRAGVSKTFILMPCSHCETQNQSLDFLVLHQVLLEHDIVLHILMNDDFHFEKERLNKMFYGLDATKSYTKKDSRKLVGDVDLRRQVKMPKSALGYCTPLSLESNGTIFSGNKLTADKASVKKFTSVFCKRVALTAEPKPCQNCECVADNSGMTKMECMPCVYPTPVTVDYVNEFLNEDDTLSALQPMDVDYSQIDEE